MKNVEPHNSEKPNKLIWTDTPLFAQNVEPQIINNAAPQIFNLHLEEKSNVEPPKEFDVEPQKPLNAPGMNSPLVNANLSATTNVVPHQQENAVLSKRTE
jgi:hypothetical protein